MAAPDFDPPSKSFALGIFHSFQMKVTGIAAHGLAVAHIVNSGVEFDGVVQTGGDGEPFLIEGNNDEISVKNGSFDGKSYNSVGSSGPRDGETEARFETRKVRGYVSGWRPPTPVVLPTHYSVLLSTTAVRFFI